MNSAPRVDGADGIRLTYIRFDNEKEVPPMIYTMTLIAAFTYKRAMCAAAGAPSVARRS